MGRNNRQYQQARLADRTPHYGLRKLSIGVASVLLSTTLYLGKTSASADTITPQAAATTATTGGDDGTTPTSVPVDQTDQGVGTKIDKSSATATEVDQPATKIDKSSTSVNTEVDQSESKASTEIDKRNQDVGSEYAKQALDDEQNAAQNNDFTAFDKKWAYAGTDLGFNYSQDSTTFKIWSPTATSVKLISYGTNTDPTAPQVSVTPMTRGTSATPNDHATNTIGVWSLTVPGDQNGLVYAYELTFDNGTVNDYAGSTYGTLSTSPVTNITNDPYSIATTQGEGIARLLYHRQVSLQIWYLRKANRQLGG